MVMSATCGYLKRMFFLNGQGNASFNYSLWWLTDHIIEKKTTNCSVAEKLQVK